MTSEVHLDGRYGSSEMSDTTAQNKLFDFASLRRPMLHAVGVIVMGVA